MTSEPPAKYLTMRYTNKGSLKVLAAAAPLAAATMLSVNSPAHSQQFMLGQSLMMVQGDMDPGRMMGRGGPMGIMRGLADMDPSRMMARGGMADMDEQQMREMMDRCDEMMERYTQDEDQSGARQ